MLYKVPVTPSWRSQGLPWCPARLPRGRAGASSPLCPSPGADAVPPVEHQAVSLQNSSSAELGSRCSTAGLLGQIPLLSTPLFPLHRQP